MATPSMLIWRLDLNVTKMIQKNYPVHLLGIFYTAGRTSVDSWTLPPFLWIADILEYYIILYLPFQREFVPKDCS